MAGRSYIRVTTVRRQGVATETRVYVHRLLPPVDIAVGAALVLLVVVLISQAFVFASILAAIAVGAGTVVAATRAVRRWRQWLAFSSGEPRKALSTDEAGRVPELDAPPARR